ncbi:MAG: outer membrane protein assembly factor BamD [Candidatus Tectomicrobia bacterium]|uniref:Outer membrane protein assembly factor BamD n=1 Tax=Tectimicrobiota bacterium TaxID=2528274 RepID=A0A937VXD4_UNCTE|nr:outer membrane protein assembly factor BamD [Candidatus Tectomicrobia bacterium]
MRRLYRVPLFLLMACGLCLPACASKQEVPKTPEDFLRLGDAELGQKRETRARKLFEQLLEQYPDSDLKAQAQFNIAETLYREGNYLEAHFEYRKFLEQYPLHPLASRAQFQLGMCSRQRIHTFDRTQVQTREALAAFRLFRSKYPQDPLIDQAEEHTTALRQRLAEHEFAVARFYYRKKAYHAAIGRFLNLIQVYPDVPEIDEAFFLLADSYREEENYRKAQGVLQLLVERFPSSKYIAQARTQLRDLPQTGITLQ